jgi:hypothetical protein
VRQAGDRATAAAKRKLADALDVVLGWSNREPLQGVRGWLLWLLLLLRAEAYFKARSS